MGQPSLVGQPAPGPGCGARVRGDSRRPRQPVLEAPVPRTANQADSAPCRTSPAPKVSTTSTCGTGTSARTSPASTSIGSGPRDRATTGGPRVATVASTSSPGRPAPPPQAGRHLKDRRDQGDVDQGEQPLEAWLPRPAVEQHRDASSPGCCGQREGEVQVVAVDEDHIHAMHEERRAPSRRVRATVGKGATCRDALTDTTARCPVPRVTSTVETAGCSSGPARSTTSTPRATRSAPISVPSAESPILVTSRAPTPNAAAVTAALAAGPPEADQQVAGHQLLVRSREAIDSLLHVEHRNTARQHRGHVWEASGAERAGR